MRLVTRSVIGPAKQIRYNRASPKTRGYVLHHRSREIRLRNSAKRQGLELRKSRRRDPRAIGHGQFCLVDKWDVESVVAAVASGFGLVRAPAASGGFERFAGWKSLDYVERVLAEGVR
jgi:hypothetical protein